MFRASGVQVTYVIVYLVNFRPFGAVGTPSAVFSAGQLVLATSRLGLVTPLPSKL